MSQTNGVTHTWPAGWTQIDQQLWNTSDRASFAYRIATGSDTAPTVTFSASTICWFQVFQFSGASTTPISAARSFATGTTGTHTSAAITTTADNSAVIYLDLSNNTTLLTNPAGWTSDADAAHAATGGVIALGHKTLAAAGSSSGAISTAGASVAWIQWQQEILAASPTSSAALQTITGSGTGYSGNVSGAVLPNTTASGSGITGSVGTSSAVLQTITASGAAAQSVPGSMSRTRQYATKAMVGFWQAAKVRQLATKSMTGITGTVAVMAKQGQMPVKSMATWPVGAMAKTAQLGAKSMLGANGSIGSMTKTAQYKSTAKTGYFNITATMTKTGRMAVKSMIAGIAPGSNFVTVSMHTEWQALTQYTNYQFNSYAQFNGVFLGANSTGLHALSGNTDNGVNIDAVLRTGVTDMGTSHLKKNEYVYVGYRATGDLMLRLNTNDSHVRDYRMAYNGETGLHVKRVKLGKGVIARYWQLEVQNINGADFDLNTLEIKPTILGRRVSGGRA